MSIDFARPDTLRRSKWGPLMLAAVAVGSLGIATTAAGQAAAAPGTPGTPQAPVVVFAEDFENGQGATPIQLPGYTGAAPVNETYSADPAWLINCNDWIASPLNPSTEPPGSGCSGFWPELPRLAGSLGLWAGTGSSTNHALGIETAGSGPGPNKVMLQTNTPISVPTNRFLGISMDAGDGSCNGLAARFVPTLLDGATAISTFSAPIQPCAQSGAIFGEDHVGTYISNNPVLFGGSSLGIRLVNAEGGAFGNDAAVDNIKIVDLSPQLDKAFGAAVVPEHGTVTLNYTITNTTELAAKNGWSFTDTLPAGLVAGPSSATTNCAGGSVLVGSGTLSVTGNLGAGQASCTASVVVTAAAPGTYTNCAANITASVGLGLPACASVSFNAAPVADAGGPYSGQEGTAVAIAGTVTDPDGPGLTSTWSIAPASGVDPGTSCSFADASAIATTVTCTDDGTYTLTLTTSDGINPSTSDSATLSLTNVAPSVSISAPSNGTLVHRGTPVGFTAPFSDIGTNDTHTCTVNFGDGTPIVAGGVTESPGSGSCTTTHSFTAFGAHTVLVTVTDDDGGSATAVVRVVVFASAEAFALQAIGLVNVPKTPLSSCPPDDAKTVVSISLGLGTVTALHSQCTVDPNTGTTTAAATVGNANLLGGLVRITDISSTCVADANGLHGSSTVGTINGIPIGLGSGSISIIGVATVFFNETSTNANGQLVQNAIRVHTLLGQDIILAGCRVG